jgi:LAO/AO transport system kinase
VTTAIDDLVSAIRRGEPLAVARAITMAERGHLSSNDLQAALVPFERDAHVVGITGPPGAGKSTLTSALIGAFRKRDQQVGVVAVDPSSPITGGSLLGDRVRMREHALDEGVHIRSMSTSGSLGGVAKATNQALRIMSAAGCSVVFVETVGVGQSEVDVVDMADTVVVLAAPGAGDEIQSQKAGIAEVGDIIAVNKSDQEGADETYRTLCRMVHYDPVSTWRRPVVRTTALNGDVDELLTALDHHWTWLDTNDERASRRERRAASELRQTTLDVLRQRLENDALRSLIRNLTRDIASGALRSDVAVQALLDELMVSQSARLRSKKCSTPEMLPNTTMEESP